MEITVKKVLATLGVILALLAAATDLFGDAAFWLGLAGLALTAIGNVIERYAGNIGLTILGVVFAGASAVSPGLFSVNERWGRIGVLIGAVVAAVGKGLYGKDVTTPPTPPTVGGGRSAWAFLLVMVLGLAGSGASCQRQSALQTINKTIHSTTFALKSADSAYQTGFLSFENRKLVFEVGKDVNATLTELNEMIAALPTPVITREAPINATDKARILQVIEEGLARANTLVEGGAWIKNDTARNSFLNAARPAQTLLMSLKNIVQLWQVKPA